MPCLREKAPAFADSSRLHVQTPGGNTCRLLEVTNRDSCGLLLITGMIASHVQNKEKKVSKHFSFGNKGLFKGIIYQFILQIIKIAII